MAVRKTPEQIKEEILDALKESPLSIEQLRKKVESNWSTVNTYLEELSKDGKVKEILSADKAKIYQRVFGDTYFDIPITDVERKKFRTLFSMIIKKYKDVNRTLNRTELAKAAVKVIKSPESGLSDLPTVWYLYGAIPLMMPDPSKEYPEEIELEHKLRINNIIEVFIKTNYNKKTKQIEDDQYVKYNERLYQLKKAFIKNTEQPTIHKKEILDTLNEFFVACPIDDDFKEVFLFTERFISTVRKLSYFDELQNHKTKILLTFDALWKFIATYKFYKSIEKRIPDKTILNLYLGNALMVRKSCTEEELSDLYSIYWSKIDDRKVETNDDVLKAKEIMQGWTGED